jgi:hypothetical protein
MGTITGRNCKVEVALTFAAAINPTAVTKASPPVVTLSAHGLANGAVGYWSSVTAGMIELQDQAFMVNNQATNTWEMPGLDSTDYTTYTAGSAIMAATWGTLSEAVSYEVGGGAVNQLDDTRLYENKTRNIAGLLPSQDIKFSIRPQEIDGTVLAFIVGKAKRGLQILVKISKGSQVLRVAYGTPSVPGESVSVGGAATADFNLVVPAWVVKPNV